MPAGQLGCRPMRKTSAPRSRPAAREHSLADFRLLN